MMGTHDRARIAMGLVAGAVGMALAFGGLPTATGYARDAADAIQILEVSGDDGAQAPPQNGTTLEAQDSSIAVTELDVSWGVEGTATTYVASGTIENSNRVICYGDVTLVLSKGCKLTVKQGITVIGSNSLTIKGEGELVANSGGGGTGNAGIGGIADQSSGLTTGTITIESGTVTAVGDGSAAGIGDGKTRGAGKVTISGGTVTATGGSRAAGIGGGCLSASGKVVISGGTVTATGGGGGAGIGTGMYFDGDLIFIRIPVTISGGTVTAKGGADSAGIGGGRNQSGSDVTISGTAIVKATGSTCTINGNTYIVSGIGAGAPVKQSQTMSPRLLKIGEGRWLYGSDTEDLSADVKNSPKTFLSGKTDSYAGDRHLHMVVNGNETHRFALTASDATITAKCSVTGCTLESDPTLTIVRPEHAAYGDGKAASATLDGLVAFNNATGLGVSEETITYFAADGSALSAAPTDAGSYVAKITVTNADGNVAYNASVSYDIAKATPGLSFAKASVTKTLGDAAFVNELDNESGVAVTYRSSDTDVATVDEKTGKVTVKAAGTATITASFAGDDNIEDGAASYELTVDKASLGLSFAKASVTKTLADAAFVNELSGESLVGLSYASSNKKVATVDASGKVTVRSAGTATITASFAGDDYYKADSASYELTVDKVSLRLSFAKASVAKTLGDAAFVNELSGESLVGLSYASSNKKVATVDASGKVTVRSAGTATITASFAGDDYYKADSACYRVVVKLAKAKGLKTVCHPGEHTVDVSWKKVKGAKGYQVQWRLRGGSWKTKTTKGTSLTLKSLKAKGYYEIRVRAASGKAKGAWSTVSRRWYVPAAGVSAKATSKGRVRVSWSKTKGANKGYLVLVRYSEDGKIVAKRTVGRNKTSVTITGLKSGRRAWVSVRPLRKAFGETWVGVLKPITGVRVK